MIGFWGCGSLGQMSHWDCGKEFCTGGDYVAGGGAEGSREQARLAVDIWGAAISSYGLVPDRIRVNLLVDRM